PARSETISAPSSAAMNSGSETSTPSRKGTGTEPANASATPAAVHDASPARARANTNAANAASASRSAFSSLKSVTLAGNAGATFQSAASTSGNAGGKCVPAGAPGTNTKR